ncbi:ATP-binding protein [Streptomyces sp. NPDC058548]|uniref:ATP-binding protein n=1 Tax=unclassified Streptomyces TaxID=2593676 RepID=UPI0036627071
MNQDVAATGWVGRHEHLEQLHEAVRSAAEGRGGRILIEGEPGLGKSALLSAAADEATRLHCHVVRGAADELGGDVPLRAILDSLTGIPQEVGGRAALLALLSSEAAPPAPAESDLSEAASRVVACLTRLGGTSPVVFLMDNLQWADDATVEVWRRICEAASGQPLLLIAAYRPAPRRSDLLLLGKEVSEQGGLFMPLTRLTEDEAAQLAEQVLGAPVGPRLVRRLARAGGNPFYVRELLDTLRSAGALDTAAGRIELVTHECEESSQPLPVRTISDRLGYLSPAAFEALRMAALLGVEFGLHELAALLDRDAAELDDVLDETLSARILGRAGAGLRFRQEVIHETLYAGMPTSLRAALHGYAAKALARPDVPEQRVAQQLMAINGALDDWAVDWLAQTIQELLRLMPATAVELAQRALDDLGEGHPARTRLEDAFAEGAILLYRPGPADRVREIRDRAVEPERVATLTWFLALQLLRDGRTAEALAEAERYATTPAGPHAYDSFIALRGFLLWVEGRREASSIVCESVLVQSGPGAGPVAEAYARCTRALHLMGSGTDEQALAEVQQGLRSVAHSPESVHVRIELILLGTHLAGRLDRPQEARAWLARGRATAESTGADGIAPALAVLSAILRYRSGHWDKALAEFAAVGEFPAHPWLSNAAHSTVALLLIAHDRREEAAAHLAALDHVRSAADAPDQQTVELLVARSLLAERESDLPRALAELRPTLDPSVAARLAVRRAWLPDLVRIALAAGDPELARTAAEAAEDDAARTPADADLDAVAQRCRGLVDEDPERLRTAVDHYRTSPFAPGLASTLEDLAVVLASTGDLDGARTQLNRAVDGYLALGAQWFVTLADARLRALGVRRGQRSVRRTHRTGWDALTPTELKVAFLVAEGLSNPRIGTELLMSARTVQTHVSHILAKLSARSRFEIAREADRRRESVQ